MKICSTSLNTISFKVQTYIENDIRAFKDKTI